MEGSIASVFNSDNPFKFFFLAGIVLLMTGLYYPFEKRQKLDLQKNEVELSDSTLVIELQRLREQIRLTTEDSKSIIKQLDSLTELKNKAPGRADRFSALINELKNSFNEKVNLLREKKHELDLKGVEVNYKNKEIEIYKSHLSEVKRYTFIFLGLGLILTLYGGINWYRYFTKPRKITE